MQRALELGVPFPPASGAKGHVRILYRALSIGKAEFLEKPFTDEALLGAIERALPATPP